MEQTFFWLGFVLGGGAVWITINVVKLIEKLMGKEE